MKFRAYLILSCCGLAFLVAEGKGASGADRIRFGLKSGIGLTTEGADPAGLGVFMNYAVSQKMSFEVEFRNSVFPATAGLQATEDISIFESLTKKEWSTRVALNFFFKRQKRCFAPYLGIGVGNYYSYNSKANIKRFKADHTEENIDFDLRKYLRHPGVFATAGMQYCITSGLTFYMQAKSTLIFEETTSLPLDPKMGFSELFNVSTGLRLTIN